MSVLSRARLVRCWKLLECDCWSVGVHAIGQRGVGGLRMERDRMAGWLLW